MLEGQRLHTVAEVVVTHFTGEGDHRAVFIAFRQPGYSSPTLKRAGLTTIRVCVMSAPLPVGRTPLRRRWPLDVQKEVSVWLTAASSLPPLQGQRPAIAAGGKLLTNRFDSRQFAGIKGSANRYRPAPRTWAKNRTLIMAFTHLKIAGLAAAAFRQQAHRANHHILLHRFAYIVNGQARQPRRRSMLPSRRRFSW